MQLKIADLRSTTGLHPCCLHHQHGLLKSCRPRRWHNSCFLAGKFLNLYIIQSTNMKFPSQKGETCRNHQFFWVPYEFFWGCTIIGYQRSSKTCCLKSEFLRCRCRRCHKFQPSRRSRTDKGWLFYAILVELSLYKWALLKMLCDSVSIKKYVYIYIYTVTIYIFLRICLWYIYMNLFSFVFRKQMFHDIQWYLIFQHIFGAYLWFSGSLKDHHPPVSPSSRLLPASPRLPGSAALRPLWVHVRWCQGAKGSC